MLPRRWVRPDLPTFGSRTNLKGFATIPQAAAATRPMRADAALVRLIVQFGGSPLMIDHISIGVRDLRASAAVYDRVLAPLGLTRLVERPATVGFGKRYPEFWLNLRAGLAPVAADTGCHVCLRAPDEAAVRAFHTAALELGCTSAGDPGPRPAAMTTYFGAFIYDRDGNKIEAVTFPRAAAG
jgi:catechol 2,3-dioxygenase-like lactoylglutathione lyase family enzyme